MSGQPASRHLFQKAPSQPACPQTPPGNDPFHSLYLVWRSVKIPDGGHPAHIVDAPGGSGADGQRMRSARSPDRDRFLLPRQPDCI